MSDFIAAGEVQTRVVDFLRIKHAIRLESKGLRHSQGSALKAAILKGYLPKHVDWLRRGTIIARREAAINYMEYVTTLLLTGEGTFARTYGENIVMGGLVFDRYEECGCPVFAASKEKTNTVGLLPYETAVMHVGHE